MGMQLIYRSSNFENLFEMIVNNELKIGDLIRIDYRFIEGSSDDPDRDADSSTVGEISALSFDNNTGNGYIKLIKSYTESLVGDTDATKLLETFRTFEYNEKSIDIAHGMLNLSALFNASAMFVQPTQSEINYIEIVRP